MKQLMVGMAFATGLSGSPAPAADMTAIVGARSGQVQMTRPVARLADQGLGYSVLHDAPGIPQRGYRVHVTCAIDESFMQTYCPTPVYVSSCPRARISCGGAAHEVRALRLKY